MRCNVTHKFFRVLILALVFCNFAALTYTLDKALTAVLANMAIRDMLNAPLVTVPFAVNREFKGDRLTPSPWLREPRGWWVPDMYQGGGEHAEMDRWSGYR